MQLYQFERIYSQMEKEFGKIRKGEEDFYAAVSVRGKCIEGTSGSPIVQQQAVKGGHCAGAVRHKREVYWGSSRY